MTTEATSLYNATEPYPCSGASPEEEALYDQLAYSLDGIGQIIIGLTGIMGNCLAIPVLISKKLNSIFNRILVFLAIFDNIFIFCSVMEGIRKNFGSIAVWHDYAFAYFGYQLQSIAILSSIFMTVVLALERYLAITKPIEYHNATQGANPWKRVWSYIIPVVIFSAIFNIPKFLETKVVERTRDSSSSQNSSDSNQTYSVIVIPTDLRLNDDYIFWYNNLAKLIITGLLPFVALCVCNTQIYKALKRRTVAMGPNATAAHSQQLNEDNRQALVLFSIVIIFLICNVPRIALNLHEVFTIDQYKKDVEHGCYNLPFWVLLSGTVSQLLMVINSSINFFIYCLMSAVFREVLFQWLKAALPKCCRNCPRFFPRARNGGEQTGNGSRAPAAGTNGTGNGSRSPRTTTIELRQTLLPPIQPGKKNGQQNVLIKANGASSSLVAAEEV